jgi:adenosine deaminase
MMRRTSWTLIVALLLLVPIDAQAPSRARPARSNSPEVATARRLAAITAEPLLLRAFLREMPKGGDLHNHLSGAVYAESYLRWAAEDGLCFLIATMTIVPAPCDATVGKPEVSSVLQNPTLYNQAIDAMSMRNWNPELNGHAHFFAAFGRFLIANVARTGNMLAEVTARAAGEHVSYLELMVTPTPETVSQFVGRIPPITGDHPDFAGMRSTLLAAGFADAIRKEAQTRLDTWEGRQREVLRCGTAQADPGCNVTVRYMAQISRAGRSETVFLQMLSGFELASGGESRLVSLNLVQPEDDPSAIRNFALQMAMMDYFHRQYPTVPIALHAGELTEGLFPPEVLRSHVRDSVRIGHASRIGHGAAAFSEDSPFDLLKELAVKKIVIEVALSSGEQILGLRGKRQPLRMFIQHGVPVTLVTDDMGVSRSTHTGEFVKAVEEHGLDYLTLKRLVRNSIQYAFVDTATKTRLKAELDAALRAFEQRHSSPAPKSNY